MRSCYDNALINNNEKHVTTHSVVVDDGGVSLEFRGARESSMESNNDSDVDSPCWKGTGVVRFNVSSEPSDAEEASRKRLNPLAPDFIPESAKQQVEFHGYDEYFECDPFSFQTDDAVDISYSNCISDTGNLNVSPMETAITSLPIEVVSSDTNNTAPPKIDVHLLINTMHDLSKLLMSSNHFESLDKHELDTILHIIHNLNEVQQRASTYNTT